MADFKKIFALAQVLCTMVLATAAPVSREYVDAQIEKVDGKIAQIEDKIKNTSQSYLYDTAIPSTNALDSFGMLYKMSTEHRRGGIWQVNQVTEQGAITHYAPLAAESGDDFTWTSSNNVFAVDYSMTTGLIRVALDIGSDTNIGWYASTTNTSPIKNELKEWSHQSGYDFASLAYVPQGENVMSNTPYDSFVRLTKHQKDLEGVVRSVNGQTGPTVTLQIPSIAGLASETYVNDKIVQSLYAQDPYKRTYLDQSIVGRLWYLEKTAQEYAHNVVYDLWSEDFSRVITGKGDVYSTTNRPYGIWTRTTISDPDTILEWFTEASEGDNQFSWMSLQSNVLVYCPTNGLLTYNGSAFAMLETNLNPAVGSDLGSVTNTAAQNIYKFTTRGWVKKDKVTTLVFDNQLASKTVTGLKYNGSTTYSHGNIELPDYAADYNSKLKTSDMYSWSSGYTPESIVGRIHQLELGGTNITKYLNRTDIAEYDDPTLIKSSIVGNVLDLQRNKHYLWSEDGMYAHNATGELFSVSIQDSKFTRSDGKVFKYFGYGNSMDYLSRRYHHAFVEDSRYGKTYFIYYVPEDGEIGFCWQQPYNYIHTNVVWGTAQSGLDPRVAGVELPNQRQVGFNTTDIIYGRGIAGTYNLTFTPKSQQRNTKPYDRFTTTNEVSKTFKNYTTTTLLEANYYNKTEVDTLIANVVEQKRIQYLYNDVDNPTQLVDSVGRLYLFGIEDLGGSFNVTVQENPAAVGKYKYDGLRRGTNYWKSAGGFFIWYDPVTGAMGDPSTTYEGSEEKKGLVPTNCAAIPPINNAPVTVASFTPQQSTEQRKYSDPFARFAFKSELDAQRDRTDQQVDEAVNYLTNAMPRIYVGVDEAAPLRFNPVYSIYGDILVPASSPRWTELTSGKGIGIPVKTMIHPTVSVRFIAQTVPAPSINNTISWLLASSDNETTPSIGIARTNGYVRIAVKYPTDEVFTLTGGLLTGGPIAFKLDILKGSGFATLSISNMNNGVAQEIKSSVKSRPNAPDDSLLMSGFSIDLDTVSVTYDDGEAKALLGQYASAYQSVEAIYVEKQLEDELGVMIGPATTNRYGVVKPDGVSIRIEDGKLVADTGGTTLDEVKKLIGQDNMMQQWPNPTDGSLAGEVLALKAQVAEDYIAITNLTKQYELLYDAVTNSAAKIQRALED